MSRYIDADELLKRLNACKYSVKKLTKRQAAYNSAISEACRVVYALPAADIPRWIPVTDLPTQYGNYLVTMRDIAFDYWQVDIATFSPKDDKWSSCDADGFYFTGEKGMKVIAGMPLPEPYKGGEEE